MLNKQIMHQLIKSGRQAIEYSMLNAVIRPRTLTPADAIELEELKKLHDLYNKWMAQYELPKTGSLTKGNDQISSDSPKGDPQ
jgi:nucleoid-associated protein YejK